MGEDVGHAGRGLFGEAVRLGMDSRGEGVVAMVEHALRKVAALDGGLNAEVAEHGVRFPAAEELDGVRIDAGAEEGGGPTWSERAGADQLGVDAGGVLD